VRSPLREPGGWVRTSVDIAVPANKWQHPRWWQAVLSVALATQRAGISIAQVMAATGALTDSARCSIADDFMRGKSEWLVQFDDDTVPPKRAIERLLALKEPFATGVYFGRVDVKHGLAPHPLIYRRVAGGEYMPVEDYYRGEIITVDGCGLGCSLIHRSLFEAVRDHYVVVRSPTSMLRPVPPDDVDKHLALGYVVYTAEMAAKDDEAGRHRNYPYFLMDSGRTEDFFWCELLDPLGYKPVADTSIECGHIGEYTIDGEDYRHALYPLQHDAPLAATVLGRGEMVQPGGGATL